ncbi:MAG: WD40/YVTN/BNR-like repeat-containing protein [Acidimicrobiales bacterium]
MQNFNDRTRIPAILAIGGAVVALVLIVFLGFRFLGGDDIDDATPPPTSPPSSETGPPPDYGDLDVPVGVEDISADYQWGPLPTGAGGFVTGLVSHPTVPDLAYARTDVAGAYRWDAEAERWTQMIDAAGVPVPTPGDYRVEGIAVTAAAPDRVYLAAGDDLSEADGRVLRSDDRGVTWVDGGQRWVLDGNAEWRTGGGRVAADPINADVVYLGTRSEGLWESTDGAATWTRLDGVPAGPTDDDQMPGIPFVLVDQTSAEVGGRAGTIYAGVARDGVYASTDGGATWSQLWATEAIPYDAEVDGDGRLVMTEREPGRVMRYDPASGQSTDISPSPDREFSSVGIDPHNPGVVVIGEEGVTSGALWRSDNGGDSWIDLEVNASCPQIPWLDAYHSDSTQWLSAASFEFDQNEPGLLWFPEGFGVWRTTTIDQPVVQLDCATLGIENMVANDIVVPPNGLPVSARWDRGVFQHPDETVASAVHGPTTRFNSAWDLDSTPADPNFVVAVVADHRFCCEGDGEAYRSSWSDDGGATWNRFGSYDNGSHPEELRFGDIAVASDDPDNIVWLPSFNQAPYFTRDRGESWTEINLPGTEDMIGDDGVFDGGSHFRHYLNRKVLVADPVAPGTFYLFHAELGMFRTSDGGGTWEGLGPGDLPVGFPYGWFNAQLIAVPGEQGHLLFSVGELDEASFPLFESTDGGATWTPVTGVSDVRALGTGAGAADGDPAVVYFAGTVENVQGVYRTTDNFGSIELVAHYPGGNYLPIQALTGHPDEFGVLYLGTTGTSFQVGRLR